MKHTPGPWTALKGGTLVVAGTVTKNEPWIIQRHVTSVARTDFTDDTDDDHERRVADALLMAAAPDLLAACKWGEHLDDWRDRNPTDEFLPSSVACELIAQWPEFRCISGPMKFCEAREAVRDKCRAAIAKAEGGAG